MELFRNFFGIHNHQPKNSDSVYGFHDQDKSNERDGRSFNVFTDPLEMHRYFEQQMDEVFRNFGFPNFRNFFHQVPGIGDSFHEEDEKPQNLREQFLKKECVKPHYEESHEKVDKDLDGKLNMGDLYSIFKGSGENTLDVLREPKSFGERFFNQSVQVKTIIKPDGLLETQKTVRDSQGNEELTITHKLGDKEYTIIKKLDKEGKEETQEILINMDENDKAIFQKSNHKPKEFSGSYFDNSLFSKFFK